MADDPERTYVLRTEKVRQSIDVLLAQDIHPFFIGYLWLRREAGRQGSLSDLQPNWPDLGEHYLAVDGGPAGKPHLRPFWTGQRNAHQEWLNQNIAGSFAPSSLRRDAYAVVEVDAERRFVLRDRHWEKALEVLLKGERVPAHAVAGFLLRDRGFVATGEPEVSDLITAFRQEFRYGATDDVEFDTLFDPSWGAEDTDWFEAFEDEGAGA